MAGRRDEFRAEDQHSPAVSHDATMNSAGRGLALAAADWIE
jgi:hypothetical protein